MKSKPLKLVVFTAEELLSKATTGATMLIVAEGKECPAKPTRRIALGWLSGETDFAQLRSAAKRFPETSFFGAADASVEHRNGTTYLKNDSRCVVSWSVRAIPMELVRCWSRYEDATGSTATQATPEATISAVVPQEESVKPAKQAQPEHPPITPMPEVSAQPIFLPLSAMTINRKRAFLGNCAGQESNCVTDGRILLLKSACSSQFSKSKTTDVGRYGPAGPIPDEQLKKIFDSALKSATMDAVIMGYAASKDVGCGNDDSPIACLITHNGDVVVVDGDKLAFVQEKSGADSVRVSAKDPEKHPVVLFKSGQAVAVAITCHAPAAVAAFQKMITAASRRLATAS